MKSFKRRNFLKYISSLPLIGVLISCRKNSKSQKDQHNQNLVVDPEAMELSKSMSNDQVFAMLDQRVKFTMQKSHNCAQTAFYALSEQFGLGGGDVLKALTPLPGIAERGETCGAITGSLMAMGLLYGRDELDDWETYRKSLKPTHKFCELFEKELGSTHCCQIQERAYGRSFNLMDPVELKEFQRAGATVKCTTVVQKACRIAAKIILENQA